MAKVKLNFSLKPSAFWIGIYWKRYRGIFRFWLQLFPFLRITLTIQTSDTHFIAIEKPPNSLAKIVLILANSQETEWGKVYSYAMEENAANHCHWLLAAYGIKHDFYSVDDIPF